MSNTVVTIEHEAIPDPRRLAIDKAKRWSSLLAKFVSVQIIVQIIGLVTGLLLIRSLSQREYAFYTIANGMQGTLSMLADLGVGSALSAIGGLVWRDRSRFGQLIQTGLVFRRGLGFVASLIIVPVAFWLLLSNGASNLYAFVITIIILISSYASLTTGVLIVVPQLSSQISYIQKNAVISSAIRIVLITVACFIFVNAAIAVSVAAFSLGIQCLLLKRWAGENADFSAQPSPVDRQSIVTVVKQQAPEAIYFCLQGQLMLFLLTVFGKTQNIAEVGALSRLAVIFTTISSVMTGIILPHFARCQNKSKLTKLYWQIISGYLLLLISIMTLVLLVPKPILWLIGNHYSHTGEELGYVVLSTLISSLYGAIYSLNSSRAWTQGVWITVPIMIAAQIVLIPFLDLGTVKGVVLLSCLPAIPGMLPFLYRAHRALQKYPSTI